MWRDILIILAFTVATLTYFNLTPKQLSGYARTAQAEVVKRTLHQRIFLLVGIITSLFFISVTIYTYTLERFQLPICLFGTSMLALMWASILTDVWKISERGERTVSIVGASLYLSFFIAALIFSDMLLWQKITYPISGFCIGYGTNALQRYIARKLRKNTPQTKGTSE